MGAQKYHIGKNGPARCNAHPERPNGRACRFGEDRHGSQAEVTAIWEQEQEDQQGQFLEGASRVSLVDPKSLSYQSLGDRSKYEPSSKGVSYQDSEQEIAMKLALGNLSELSYLPVDHQDHEWETLGCSSVERYILKDGSVGYFKPFSANSKQENYFRDEFGTSSLGASINEVNAYRMAKLLGEQYEDLVPETSFREINGTLGTLQREVEEDEEMSSDYDYVISRSFKGSAALREDYRKAAIFDFVIGNLDRHPANFLYGLDKDDSGESRNRIRLIDNSFAFPDSAQKTRLNASVFADNEGAGEGRRWEAEYEIPERELGLRPLERHDLLKARKGARDWVAEGTIDPNRGQSMIDRIDHLLLEDKLGGFRAYHYRGREEDDEDW